MAKLTKRELTLRISNETGLAQQHVVEVIQKTLDYITDSLAGGGQVELRNFGVFEVRLTKPRVGRNPKKSGSEVVIPARSVVKFKMGKVMGQKVSKLTAALKRKTAGE